MSDQSLLVIHLVLLLC